LRFIKIRVLNDYNLSNSTELKDGILKITLVKVIPEEDKPKVLEIL
jgi:HSP20 family molecular chaperone IbpA